MSLCYTNTLLYALVNVTYLGLEDSTMSTQTYEVMLVGLPGLTKNHLLEKEI